MEVMNGKIASTKEDIYNDILHRMEIILLMRFNNIIENICL